MKRKKKPKNRDYTRMRTSKKARLNQLALSTKYNAALTALNKLKLTVDEKIKVQQVRGVVTQKSYNTLKAICRAHNLRERDFCKIY